MRRKLLFTYMALMDFMINYRAIFRNIFGNLEKAQFFTNELKKTIEAQVSEFKISEELITLCDKLIEEIKKGSLRRLYTLGYLFEEYRAEIMKYPQITVTPEIKVDIEKNINLLKESLLTGNLAYAEYYLTKLQSTLRLALPYISEYFVLLAEVDQKLYEAVALRKTELAIYYLGRFESLIRSLIEP